MKFLKLRGTTKVNVNVAEYQVDWGRKVSGPQKRVKDFLRPYWVGGIVLEEFRIPGSLIRIDLLNLTRRIVVEVSPSSSHSFNQFFHKTRDRFGAAVKRDLDKAAWCEREGFTFIEVFEDDLDNLSPEWFMTKYGVTL